VIGRGLVGGAGADVERDTCLLDVVDGKLDGSVLFETGLVTFLKPMSLVVVMFFEILLAPVYPAVPFLGEVQLVMLLVVVQDLVYVNSVHVGVVRSTYDGLVTWVLMSVVLAAAKVELVKCTAGVIDLIVRELSGAVGMAEAAATNEKTRQLIKTMVVVEPDNLKVWERYRGCRIKCVGVGRDCRFRIGKTELKWLLMLSEGLWVELMSSL
jgi:hypothetical protein